MDALLNPGRTSSTNVLCENAGMVPATDFAPVNYESEAPTIRLNVIGTYRTGIFGNNTAAAAAHDPGTHRLFVVNEGQNKLDVLDIRDPSHPVLLFSIDLSPFGSLPTHVAVNNGRVAITHGERVRSGQGGLLRHGLDRRRRAPQRRHRRRLSRYGPLYPGRAQGAGVERGLTQ